VLIVAAPQVSLLEEESEAIKAYLGDGGKALVMQEPGEGADLAEILVNWGVQHGEDVIIDPDRALFGMDRLSPVVDRFTFQEISRDLPGVVIITARSITRTVEQPENFLITALVESSEGSWGETDFDALGKQEAQYDLGEDATGPLAMVMSVEAGGTGEETPNTPLVVCGDSDFTANSSLTLGGNGDLFLNSVSWLAEEEELISIRPKPPVSRMLILSPGEARFVQYSSVVLLPLAVLAVGTVVWWRRR